MDPARTTSSRLPGAGICDACHQRVTIVFRVNFDDDTYSRRCARHVAAMYDHAARRHQTESGRRAAIAR